MQVSDGSMDQWMNKWTDRWMDPFIYPCIHPFIHLLIHSFIQLSLYMRLDFTNVMIHWDFMTMYPIMDGAWIGSYPFTLNLSDLLIWCSQPEIDFFVSLYVSLSINNRGWLMLDKTRNWKEMSSIQSVLYTQDCIIKSLRMVT